MRTTSSPIVSESSCNRRRTASETNAARSSATSSIFATSSSGRFTLTIIDFEDSQFADGSQFTALTSPQIQSPTRVDQPLHQVRRVQRLRDEVALREVASDIAQHDQRLLVLHSLGADLLAEMVSEIDDGADD